MGSPQTRSSRRRLEAAVEGGGSQSRSPLVLGVTGPPSPSSRPASPGRGFLLAELASRRRSLSPSKKPRRRGGAPSAPASIEDLHSEILLHIFEKLDTITLREVLPLVSKAFCRLLKTPEAQQTLWSHIEVHFALETVFALAGTQREAILGRLNAPTVPAALADWQEPTLDELWALLDREQVAAARDAGAHICGALVQAFIAAKRGSVRRLTFLDDGPDWSWHDFTPEQLAFTLGRCADSLEDLSVFNCNGLVTRGAVECIGTLPKLRRLTLDTHTVDMRQFSGLERLEALSLGAEAFYGLQELAKFSSLTSLRLGGSEYAGWARVPEVPQALRALGKLQALALDGCCIRAVPAWLGPALPALRALCLRSNELEGLPESLGTLQRLTSLDLKDNRFVTLPPVLRHLAALETLDLHRNPCTMGGPHLRRTAVQLSALLPRWPALTELRVMPKVTVLASDGSAKVKAPRGLKQTKLGRLMAELAVSRPALKIT